MEKVNKRLLGVEDVNWDETGRGESENFTGSDGAVKVLRKINESHIPLSNALRELFPGSTYLTHILVKLQEMCSSSGGGGGTSGPGGMSNDKVVNFSSSMSASEIQIMIDEQEKNLGQHTLTFKFSENSYQLVNQSIVFDGFYNGKIIIDGNGSTVTDTGNIGSLFLFDVCVCPVEFQNFIVQMQSSSYCIEAKATLGIFVENCQMTGSAKTFFVNTILSDAVFDGNCAFSGGAQKITGYVYNWVKENYLPLKGGSVTGNLSVTGKSVVLSVNGVLANNAGNVTISISHISGLQSALDDKFSIAGGAITGREIKRSAADSYIHILGGNGGYNTDGQLVLYGADYSGNAGGFELRTADRNTYISLAGRNNGGLTWQGKNIVRSVDGVNADSAGNVALGAIKTIDGVKADSAGNVTLNALKTTGGTMTGTIKVPEQAIRATTDSGVIRIYGGTGADSAGIFLFGKGRGDAYAGQMYLSAQKGTDVRYLVLSPDGNATWGGKHIVRSVDGVNAGTAGNVALGALKTSGGALTGSITFSAGNILNADTKRSFAVYGGTTYATGPALILYGKDYPTSAYTGVVVLSAHDGSRNTTLVCRPDGTMTWNSKDITLGYPNYSAGVAVGTVSTYTATADGWVQVTKQQEATYITVKVNGAIVVNGGGSSHDRTSGFFPVKKGDVVTIFKSDLNQTSLTAVTATVTFYPNR